MSRALSATVGVVVGMLVTAAPWAVWSAAEDSAVKAPTEVTEAAAVAAAVIRCPTPSNTAARDA